jgi:hypothetical protein
MLRFAGKNLKIFVGYANLQAEGLQNNNTPPGIFDTDFFRIEQHCME